jgi:hypothetical protein
MPYCPPAVIWRQEFSWDGKVGKNRNTTKHEVRVKCVIVPKVLKFGGHLGEFGDGVHVAGGAVF